MRVLIADDDRDTLMTLGILIRSEGIDVRLVGKGAEVDAAVRDFRPDVVLLDLGMPDRSGLQVALDLVRQHGTDCPVLIAITAHGDAVSRRLSAKSGFMHHIAKPYDPDSLRRLIASLPTRN